MRLRHFLGDAEQLLGLNYRMLQRVHEYMDNLKASSRSRWRYSKLWKPIGVAALVAGSADLVYACIHIGSYYKIGPLQIFQSIARGVLGSAAKDGALGSAGLGIALEFLMTLIMAAIYIIPSKRITDLRRYWWLFGPCYGIVVMVVMYTVVLPLSAVHGSGALPDGPRGSDGKITDHQMLYGTILVHMFIVGLVVSACARFLWPKEGARGET